MARCSSRRCGAVAARARRDWRPLVAGRPAVRARGRQRAARRRDRGDLRLSGSFLALVLAMALLGPAPAAVIGASASLDRRAVSRRPSTASSTTSPTYATFPLVGGLADRERWSATSSPAHGDPLGSPPSSSASSWPPTPSTSRWSPADGPRRDGVPVGRARAVFVTALPSEFATGAADRRRRVHLRRISASARSAWPRSCSSSSCTSCARASRPRSVGRSSTKRTRELASLQMGLLSTVLQTLSMRDAMTARHSAAVARYSREVAAHAGPRRARAGPDPHRGAAARHRQVHPPGRVLFANRKLTDDEWELSSSTPSRARSSSNASRATALSPRSSCTTTSGSPAAATRPASRGEEIPLGARIIVGRRHLRRDDRRATPTAGR